VSFPFRTYIWFHFVYPPPPPPLDYSLTVI
jgi:hypothetical protein